MFMVFESNKFFVDMLVIHPYYYQHDHIQFIIIIVIIINFTTIQSGSTMCFIVGTTV